MLHIVTRMAILKLHANSNLTIRFEC